MKKCLLLAAMAVASLHAVAQTFTEIRNINCGDTAYVENLGYPTWNPPQLVELPNYGHAALLGDFIAPNLLQYTAPPFFDGADTVVIECAYATQITCDTGVYVFNITCSQVISPVFATIVPCNDSVYIGNLSGWWAPQIQDQAQHGHARIVLEPTDGAGVAYRPDPGFEGVDAVTVSLMGGNQTWLYLFQVYCDLTTSINEHREAAPLVFPNPVGDRLFIKHKPTITYWFLSDLHGVEYPVLLQHGEGDIAEIDLSAWPAGMYLLVGANDTGGVWTIPIVKK